jgi:AraC-like DNA-binding protein
MPIYMDVHILPGVRSKDVAHAHYQDLLHQEEFACNCMTYWVDEERGNVFCLIEAPTKEAVEEMHGKAHGLVPNKVIEVSPNVVSSFLGRIYDPETAEADDTGLKVFADPSFRVIMQVRIQDALLLKHCLGNDKAEEMLHQYKQVTRSQLAAHGGSEVECGGNDFVVSFSSASKAVSCALAIQKELQQPGQEDLNLKISLNGGEPVEKSNTLFGDAIQLGGCMCAIAGNAQVVVTAGVKELVAKDHGLSNSTQLLVLTPQEEGLLRSLFDKLEANWQKAEFDMDDYCKEMAMSNSQLYRKTIQLTGMSPNILLKEFRLEKAKELMRRKKYPIAQITFESGFTSPSYFTKCFKKKYGLLPMAYLEMLH